MTKRRIGIVGYGHLGRYLSDAIINDPQLGRELELAFIYNRSKDKIDGVANDLILANLDDFASKRADLIVEVAHPDISRHYALRFLEHADYMVGSPTVFADAELEREVRAAATKPSGYGLYLPRGAMWYLPRLLEVASPETIVEMRVIMKKHPGSLKYQGPMATPLDKITAETVLYHGPVADVCRYAPNNVNTMAIAALAVPHLGFSGVEAKLVADPSLTAHIIEIELFGPGEPESRYYEKAQRYNPAKTGEVTGSATYKSFLDSLRRSVGAGDGVHFR